MGINRDENRLRDALTCRVLKYSGNQQSLNNMYLTHAKVLMLSLGMIFTSVPSQVQTPRAGEGCRLSGQRMCCPGLGASSRCCWESQPFQEQHLCACGSANPVCPQRKQKYSSVHSFTIVKEIEGFKYQGSKHPRHVTFTNP